MHRLTPLVLRSILACYRGRLVFEFYFYVTFVGRLNNRKERRGALDRDFWYLSQLVIHCMLTQLPRRLFLPSLLDLYRKSLLGLLGFLSVLLRGGLGLFLLSVLVLSAWVLRLVNVHHLHVRADVSSVRY